MRREHLALLFFTGMAAACSAPQAAAPPPSAPSMPAVSFDGRYNGNIRITRSHNNWCDTPPTFSFVVANNAFTWTLTRPHLPQKGLYNPTFQVTIGPDGVFDVEGGNGELTSLKGRIIGPRMTGDIDGKYCGYVFSADKS
jgi:hypothetical protein